MITQVSFMIYEVVRGSRFERAGGHELGDQQDTLVAFTVDFQES